MKISGSSRNPCLSGNSPRLPQGGGGEEHPGTPLRLIKNSYHNPTLLLKSPFNPYFSSSYPPCPPSVALSAALRWKKKLFKCAKRIFSVYLIPFLYLREYCTSIRSVNLRVERRTYTAGDNTTTPFDPSIHESSGVGKQEADPTNQTPREAEALLRSDAEEKP